MEKRNSERKEAKLSILEAPFTHRTLGLLLVFLSGWACSGNGQDPQPVTDETIDVHGPYLGQVLPGLSPLRFGPRQLHATQNWFWHGGPSFSPSGMEMFFARYDVGRDRMEIYGTSGTDEGWTLPAPAPFGLGVEANQPTWSGGGDTLYFVDHDALLRVTQTDGAWSSPVPVGGGVNTSYSALGPLIAPDESYLIFGSNRPGGLGMHDLWISFRDGDGGWSEPLNMGPAINSSNEDGGATLSPDGRFLFFTTEKAGDSGYNAYWVSTAVIDSLRKTFT